MSQPHGLGPPAQLCDVPVSTRLLDTRDSVFGSTTSRLTPRLGYCRRRIRAAGLRQRRARGSASRRSGRDRPENKPSHPGFRRPRCPSLIVSPAGFQHDDAKALRQIEDTAGIFDQVAYREVARRGGLRVVLAAAPRARARTGARTSRTAGASAALSSIDSSRSQGVVERDALPGLPRGAGGSVFYDHDAIGVSILNQNNMKPKDRCW